MFSISRFFWIAGCLCAVIALVMPGCGRSTSSPAADKAELRGAQTPDPVEADAEAPEQAGKAAEPAPEVKAGSRYQLWETALAKRDTPEARAHWDAVAAGRTPQTVDDGLDLVDMYTQVSGEGVYTFWLLFHTTADIDIDYHMLFEGAVVPSNAKLLTEKDRKRAMVKFPHRLNDNPSSTWKKGQYHLVEVAAEIPTIPYNLLLVAFAPTEEEFWNQVGNRVNLGWQWAASDYAALTKKIEACTTAAELYALAPRGPHVPGPVQQAMEKKWKALAAGATPRKLADGINLLSLDTKATGEREYTFSFLVHATADISERYIFTTLGRVDPSHQHFIDPQKPGRPYTSWSIDPKYAPTYTWRADDYHVIQRIVESEIIPYNMSVWVSPWGEDGWNWDEKGPVIDCGWQADLKES